jgi:hypothetical protein
MTTAQDTIRRYAGSAALVEAILAAIAEAGGGGSLPSGGALGQSIVNTGPGAGAWGLPNGGVRLDVARRLMRAR